MGRKTIKLNHKYHEIINLFIKQVKLNIKLKK